MSWQRILQWVTGLVLGAVATFILISEADAHVTMCMFCAIGYSVALIIPKPEELMKKLTSFFAGGILFYTIYVGSTMMYFEWFAERLWDPGSWLYHIGINLAILTMFITKKDKVEHILYGLEAFMITSPVMLLINDLTGRRLWDWEGAGVIVIYVVIGIVLAILHKVIKGNQIFGKILNIIRVFIIASMIFYTITISAMIAFSKGINTFSGEPRP